MLHVASLCCISAPPAHSVAARHCTLARSAGPGLTGLSAPVWHANLDPGEERIALLSSECRRECCRSASERRGLCLVAAKRSSAAPRPAEGSPFAEPIAPACSGTIDRLWSEGATQPPMQLATPVRSRHRCGAAPALPRLPTLPYRTVPYLHCAAPSGAPTGRPGFNPAVLSGVQPGFNPVDLRCTAGL